MEKVGRSSKAKQKLHITMGHFQVAVYLGFNLSGSWMVLNY